MSFEMKGKTVLITGANRGIGAGFVSTLLAAGVKTIYAAARNVDNLTELVQLNPGVIKPIQLDITNPAQIKAVCDHITSLDILINNAGIIDPALCSAENATELARKEMEVNLFGPMQLTSGLLPALKQSKQALIVNISSIAAIANFPSIGTYSISKAAMHSYSEGLRADLNKEGIIVMCVYPGPTDTRMAAGMEMDKPQPITVAQKTLISLDAGEYDVFPDDFAKEMYRTFLTSPQKLAAVFAEMG